jgi:hypothetical protein
VAQECLFGDGVLSKFSPPQYSFTTLKCDDSDDHDGESKSGGVSTMFRVARLAPCIVSRGI